MWRPRVPVGGPGDVYQRPTQRLLVCFRANTQCFDSSQTRYRFHEVIGQGTHSSYAAHVEPALVLMLALSGVEAIQRDLSKWYLLDHWDWLYCGVGLSMRGKVLNLGEQSLNECPGQTCKQNPPDGAPGPWVPGPGLWAQPRALRFVMACSAL